jgi:glutathione S-transferase
MARHFVRTDPWPELTRWYARITERPAFVQSLPPEGAERLYKKDFYEAWDG